MLFPGSNLLDLFNLAKSQSLILEVEADDEEDEDEDDEEDELLEDIGTGFEGFEVKSSSKMKP